MNIVTAVFTDGNYKTETRPLWQYDYGQILKIEGFELPQSYEVHFSNELDGTSTTVIGNENGVAIPDACLAKGKTYAWLYLHTGDDDGETVRQINIPVRGRAVISNQQPTPAQQDIITQTIAALNAAIADIEGGQGAPGNGIESITMNADYTLTFQFTDGTSYTTESVRGEKGNQGDKGDKGDPGESGHTPIITSEKNGNVTTISVDGIVAATINDGTDGQDGHSPVASVSKTGSVTTITITDANGTTTAQVNDGDVESKADKTDTVLNTTLSRGRATESTVGAASFAFGDSVIASGNASHAEGGRTAASGNMSHAEGSDSIASGIGSHAEGNSTQATNSFSHAEGNYTKATGQFAHSEGLTTLASGLATHAEGYGGTFTVDGTSYTSGATQTGSHSEGYTTLAAGNTPGVHAEGYCTIAGGNSPGDHAEGFYTKATGGFSHSEGGHTAATGCGDHAEGYYTKANSNYYSSTGNNGAHAEGVYAYAYGKGAHAEGSHDNTAITVDEVSYYPGAYAAGAHAEGTNTLALGAGSHAEGSNNKATGEFSHAEGTYGTARGAGSHTEGCHSSNASATINYATYTPGAYAPGAHIEGTNTYATNTAAHAEGNSTVASGLNAHAEGFGTSASSQNAHAEGNTTYASSINAHAEGYNTRASNSEAHTEGRETQASGEASHAEGNATIAAGKASHAEGFNTHTTGNYSHAEGNYTYAGGHYSHAEGDHADAEAASAHAEGTYTKATGESQHVVGRYNKVYKFEDLPTWAAGTSYEVGDKVKRVVGAGTNGYVCTTANSSSSFTVSEWDELSSNKYVEIVGNGSSSARSNARTLDWEGNAWYAGDVSVGANSDYLLREKNLAERYDATATYVVGDYCIYGGQLYKCTTAISTAETWTAAHWTATNVAQMIAALNAAIQNASIQISVTDDGNGNVTISSSNGGGASTNIAVTGVSFANLSGSITVGDTFTLIPVFTPSNATNKTGTWATSDSSIATVSNGVVSAVAAGSANITFTSTDGNYTATYVLTVTAIPVAHSNNILNPETEMMNWTSEVGAGKYMKIQTESITGLGSNNNTAYVGTYDISGLNLSGATVVFNVAIRTLGLSKDLPNESYRVDSGRALGIVTSNDSAVQAGNALVFPEFDDTVYKYLSITVQYASNVLSMLNGDKPLYMSTKVPYSASDVDEYSEGGNA